jgi:hypothetical protein
MKRNYFIPLVILLLLLLITSGVIFYGKGYRIGQQKNGNPTITKTGLLSVNSEPNGAQVYINNNLTTATNDTVDLLPGDYTVKITKDGFLPWQKKVKIEKEVVTKADALLFPAAPRFENITSNGVENPVLDPSGRKIAFRIASESAKKNGIYILDMSSTPILSLQSSAHQITDDITATFSTSDYIWSPDGTNLIASISALPEPIYYLLNSTGFNDTPRNITALLPSMQDQWTQQKIELATSRTNGLKNELKQLIKDDFNALAWSPDDDKILYSASRSATLPVIIKPRRIGIDTLREDRIIKENDLYVYAISDDINFKVMDAHEISCKDKEVVCSNEIQWYPDSDHLIIVKDRMINIMEIDGTNDTTVYAGPFIDHYVFPWPNGSKIVILTNFNNPAVPANLYTIGLK